MDHQIEQVVGVGNGPSDRAGCGGGEWTIR